MEEVFKKMFGPSWVRYLKHYIYTKKFIRIGKAIHRERSIYKVYPEREDLFRCFRVTPIETMKVVILGQDPYHNPNSADGLAFSNSRTKNISPSLRNILKEVDNCYPEHVDNTDYGRSDRKDLARWGVQGVLLLNTAQTVREKSPGSHHHLWDEFTDEIINVINEELDIVWILLGSKSQSFIPKISKQHCILKAPHPAAEIYSGGSAGFFDSKIFKRANNELNKRNRGQIHW